MWRWVVVVCALLVCCVHSQAIPDTPGFSVAEATGYSLVATSNGSALFDVVIADNNPYASNQPLLLAVLNGTHYQIGYDYALLLGPQSMQNLKSLIISIIGKQWEWDIVASFLQWQWDRFLSVQLPAEFVDELNGLRDGGRDSGLDELERFVTYGITLANFPDSVVDNVLWLLIDEFGAAKGRRMFEAARSLDGRAMRCSMFGAWGSRTEGGRLYTARNLDWAQNTGISQYKLLAVYHVTGRIPYVTVGFAGMIGALTGMSAAGITVHEAGNNVRNETFLGFPWVLRLRWVMETAADLQQALDVWFATNNTVGMQHGIGSGVDQRFVALETMAAYTAVFKDNSRIEADYHIRHRNGSLQKMGFPLLDAVWRTNHGFDPFIVAAETAPPTDWTSDSEKRYLVIHNALVDYELRRVLVADLQAINITSCVAMKGADPYSCANLNGAANIISATYRPADLRMFVAFEQGGKGTDQPWLPACCGTYVHIDMAQWFERRAPLH